MTRTILVVDDDPNIREFVSAALVDEGYQTVSANNGAAALQIVDKHPLDLLLLDLRMPIMDGWTFLKRYCQRPDPHVPIIVMSASVIDAKPFECVVAVVPKPFDLDVLLECVEEHLS